MKRILATALLAAIALCASGALKHEPDGTTFTLAVNISAKPVSFALPGGRTVTLEPHGFDLHEGRGQ